VAFEVLNFWAEAKARALGVAHFWAWVKARALVVAQFWAWLKACALAIAQNYKGIKGNAPGTVKRLGDFHDFYLTINEYDNQIVILFLELAHKIFPMILLLPQ